MALLDLTTLERPSITIDGAAYEIMRPEDFGLRESVKLNRLRNEVNAALARQDDMTDDDILALAGALDTLTGMILPDVPADVLGRLRDGQKLQIVAAFSRLAPTLGQAAPTAATR